MGYDPLGGGNAGDAGDPNSVIDAGDLIDIDAPPPLGEPITLTIDRVAADAIYGTFGGFDAEAVVGIDVVDDSGTVLRTLTGLTTTGNRFAILLGDELLAGLGVVLKVRSAQGGTLVETSSLQIPSADDASVVSPRDLHLSYFTNEFYIGLTTAGTHCLDLVGENGEVHTVEGCVQLDAADNALVDLSTLSGTIAMDARYSLCERGTDQVTSCTSLITLRNHLAVDRLVLDSVYSIFSIVLGGNLSFCIRIMDENQTQILLNDSSSPHACVGTYISGYASQDIPLSQLTSTIDPLLKYAICNIDNRGLAYSVCTPLALLEMP